MKLRNSVEDLKAVWDLVLANHMGGVKEMYSDAHNNQRVKDPMRAFRWNVWFAINREMRDDIISKSIPKDKWVGGYPDITSDQIDTLLKRVITGEQLQPWRVAS